MNHRDNTTCCHCGSTLYQRSSGLHCSGDNLKAIKDIFDEIIEIGEGSEYESRLINLGENEFLFDLYMDYYNRIKKSTDAPIKCIHEDTYFREAPTEEGRLPMPKSYIDFPDLAEVYIAEIMLGRELTGFEKDGSRHIPKIDEDGTIYFGTLTWIIWPHSYMSKIKASGLIEGLEPLPVLFNIDNIRGLYSDRAGDIIDE